MKEIFVSSTFRDMQEERDLLKNVIAPTLRTESRTVGDSVNFVDLRWGIDTSQPEMDEISAMSKILQSCLNCVERSLPYFLIILGNYYGTCIDREVVRGLVPDDFVDSLSNSISVTQLEIEYAIYKNKTDDFKNFVCCFRNDISSNDRLKSNAEDTKKLIKLKEKLVGLKNVKIITYDKVNSATNEFEKDYMSLECQVKKAFMDIFSTEWDSVRNIHWQEKEKLIFSSLMSSYLKMFRGREKLLDNYVNDEKNSDILIIRGEAGSGKSSLISRLMFNHLNEANAFIFYSKSSDYSESIQNFMDQMIFALECKVGKACEYENYVNGKLNHYYEVKEKIAKLTEKLNIFDDTLENSEEYQIKYSENKKEQNALNTELRKSYYDYCNCIRIRGKREYIKQLAEKLTDPFYFYIDAIDELETDEHIRTLTFLVKDKNIKYVISCRNDFILDINRKESVVITEREVPLLENEDINDVIVSIFGSKYKEVNINICRTIMQKEHSRNPLYLNLIMHRLSLINGDILGKGNPGYVNEKCCELVRSLPDNICDAILIVVKDAIESLECCASAMWDAINLIAVSEEGISEENIYDILNSVWCGNELNKLEILIALLDFMFIKKRDGRIDFTNKAFKDSICHNIDEICLYREMLYKFVKEQPEDSDISNIEGFGLAAEKNDLDMAAEIIIRLQRGTENNIYKNIKKAIVKVCLKDNGHFLLNNLDYFFNDYPDANIRLGLIKFYTITVPRIFEEYNVGFTKEIEFRILKLNLSNEDDIRNCCRNISLINNYFINNDYSGSSQLFLKERTELTFILENQCRKYDLFLCKKYNYIRRESHFVDMYKYLPQNIQYHLKNSFNILIQAYNILQNEFFNIDLEKSKIYSELSDYSEEVEEDRRKYKKRAKEMNEEALQFCNEGLLNEAYWYAETAADLYEKEYYNTNNPKTMVTLYEMCNELGAKFYEKKEYKYAHYFFSKCVLCAKNGFGEKNKVIAESALKIAEDNLKIVEELQHESNE